MEGGVEFRHLEALVAIVEEGSFTSAADVLNTVQSNVSEQIRQLEAELGVPLLVRGDAGGEEPALSAGRAARVRPLPQRWSASRRTAGTQHAAG